MRADRLAGRKDLLHEVDVGGFRNAETGRAGDRAVKRRVLADELARRTDQLDRLFAHLGEVALIVFVDDLSIAHDYDFHRRRADVDANIYIHILIVLPGSEMRRRTAPGLSRRVEKTGRCARAPAQAQNYSFTIYLFAQNVNEVSFSADAENFP